MHQRLHARLVIVPDLVEAFARGVVGKRFEHDRRARHVIEDAIEPLVEQRQPMLHAGMAATLAYRGIDEIVRGRRAKGFDIAETEAPDGLTGELEFGNRNEIETAQLVGRALGLRIETADGFERVAKKVEPDRLGHAGCVEVDDAATHRIVAWLAHGGGARKTVEFEPAGDALHGKHVSGRSRERQRRDPRLGRHPLERGVDGGEQDGGPVAPLEARQPRKRRHAVGDHAGMGRHPVIGQAIPGGELQHRKLRREEGERARERRHARAVAADDEQAGRRRVGACGDSTGKIGDHEALGAVGDAGQRQRAAGSNQLGWRSRRKRHRAPSPESWNSRSRRKSGPS